MVRRLLLGSLRLGALISCPLYMGLAALAPICVPTVFGQALLDAVPVVQAMMMVLGVLSSLSVIQAAVIRGRFYQGSPGRKAGSCLASLQATALWRATAALGMAASTSSTLWLLSPVTPPLVTLAICIGLGIIVYWAI